MKNRRSPGDEVEKKNIIIIIVMMMMMMMMMMTVNIMIMRKINSPSVYEFLNFRLLNRAFGSCAHLRMCAYSACVAL